MFFWSIFLLSLQDPNSNDPESIQRENGEGCNEVGCLGWIQGLKKQGLIREGKILIQEHLLRWGELRPFVKIWKYLLLLCDFTGSESLQIIIIIVFTSIFII